MSVNVGINGFGRIGRLFVRAAAKRGADVNIVAVNDVTDAGTMRHLFKYDSVHGVWPGEVVLEGDALVVDGHPIKVLSETEPDEAPLEGPRRRRGHRVDRPLHQREAAAKHLEAGAKKVIISAPAGDADITIVLGVNDDMYDPAKHDVISNASCTTNCLAPVAKVLDDAFGIEKGFMTTIHAYTNDQKILDFPHKDLRRARAAALSIIPTTTGAASAVGLVLPELKGKLDGFSLRVPTPDGSCTDLTAIVAREVTSDEVNAALKAAADGPMKGILEVCDDPIVSMDFVGNPASSIVDSALTMASGTMVKVVSWYDNEWGYTCRLVDLAQRVL